MHKLVSQDKKEVAQAMMRAGKSPQEVACTLEISRASVYRIRQAGSGGGVSPVARQIGRQMAGKYLALVEAILGGIEEEDILDAPLKERAIVANMFMDKAMSLIADGEEIETDKTDGYTERSPDSGGCRNDEEETDETGGGFRGEHGLMDDGFRMGWNDGDGMDGDAEEGVRMGREDGDGMRIDENDETDETERVEETGRDAENPISGDLGAESGGCEVGMELEEN